MFTRLLYFNKDRVIEYNAIISDEDFTEFDEIEITSSNTVGGDVKILNGKKESQHNKRGKIHSANTRMWNTFLSNLRESDYFIDCIEADKSLTSIGRDNIVRIETIVEIPEKFDTFSIINSLPKDFISDQLISEIDENDKDLVRNFFKIKKASMPIVMESNEQTLCAKLHTNCFMCDEEEFEDALEEELVVVAKVISPHKSKDKELFNPLKDFFVLNRATRRSVEVGDQDGLENIYCDKDYVYVEILAIYQ